MAGTLGERMEILENRLDVMERRMTRIVKRLEKVLQQRTNKFKSLSRKSKKTPLHFSCYHHEDSLQEEDELKEAGLKQENLEEKKEMATNSGDVKTAVVVEKPQPKSHHFEMAEHAAVTFLLEQVTEVIKSHADLISGADKEFQKLKDDVAELKDILMDTANTTTDDQGIRLIKNKIRDVVYEVEDTIDNWLTDLKGKSEFSRTATNLSFAKKVKTLREGQVKEMLETAKGMKTALKSLGTTNEIEVQERWTDPPISQVKIVGLKYEAEVISSYLRNDQPGLTIIPIIGMPGLGKTTLAWIIYNREIIRYDFPIRIWVHFSRSRDVLIQIMKHFTANMDKLYSMSSGELCHEVKACLSREKFLLVLDNVWTIEDWNDIIYALPYKNGDGRVIVTSCLLSVGRHVKRNTEPHFQQPMNRDESWELLQLEVFGRLGDCPDALKDIGSVIAEKCEGIPMTIVVLGGVLKDSFLLLKSDMSLVRKKWNEVAENVNLALEGKKEVIVDIMQLSYNRLPDRLRDCFLYLGVFPAGYMIPAWTLTRLWIAEGFIQPDGEQSLEKIAEDNLNDLISRNLLTVHKMNSMREVKVCHVYDFIRVFCTGEAEKQNLFTNNANQIEKIHRLFHHSDLDKFFSEDPKGPRVRSFLCFRNDVVGLDPEYISAIPESFPNLRILQSGSIKFNQFPQRVTRLSHLRYIVLCVADLKILPEPLSQLWNLQTIVVDTDSDSLTMKANLWKMMRLRHVKTKAAIVLLDKTWEGEAGENLQTLNRLSPESVPGVARRAINLKTLGIRGNLAPLLEDMPLGYLSRLENLKLYHEEAPLHHFPHANRFPPNLKRLTLSSTFLDWKHMATLANIHHLEVLKLKENAFTGISWEAHNLSFSKLQVLHMSYLDLVIWTASDSAFPCLRHLELKNCETLNAIPNGVLQRLENLGISRVRKSIVDSAMNLKIHVNLGDNIYGLP